MSAAQDWQARAAAKRERNRRMMEQLFPDANTRRKEMFATLRKILETYDNGELDDVIEQGTWSKEDKIDLIMDNGFLDDAIEEIIMQEYDEKKPTVAHLIRPIDRDPKIAAHQDCDHAFEGKPYFDLLDRCWLCGRTKSECVA